MKPTVTFTRSTTDRTMFIVTRDGVKIGYIFTQANSVMHSPRLIAADGSCFEAVPGDYYDVRSAALAIHKATK